MVLQSIRERLTGIIAVFVFGILIIPFAFVGVGSYFQSDAVNAVALINGEEISVSDFTQSFQNYRRRMQSQLGENFDPEMFDQLIIRRQHLDSLIDQELLVQVSREAGLAVDDRRLAETIRNELAFQVDGEFNADVYEARLAAAGMTPTMYEDEVRSRLVFAQIPEAVASSAITTPWELEQYVHLQEQTRSFSALVIPAEVEDETPEPVVTEGEEAVEPAPVTPPPVIEEEAVQAWYEENPADFMSEEQVIVEYLELDAAFIGGEVDVTEEYLQDRFEEQQTRFINPEARMASHILFEVAPEAPQLEDDTAFQKAEEARARAMEEGADFAELARELSEDIGSAEQGGDLGWIEPGFMVQAFEDALYELTPESPVSAPVKTGFGWHVIYLRDIRPSEGMSFTEAREVLLQEYQAEEDERRFIEQADRLIDIIYEDPTTLDAAADELNLPVLETEAFGRLGNPAGGISSNPEVVRAAFSDLVLAQGSVSDPIDLGTNHMVLVRLKEHLPQALKPLDDVREEVVTAIREKRAVDAARERAEALLASIQSGSSLAEQAEAMGIDLVNVEAGKRYAAGGADPELVQKVFLMNRPAEGESSSEVVELQNGFAVVQLDAVADGELTEGAELIANTYERMISNGTASEEALGFMRMLRSQSEIEVFEDRLR